VQQWRAAAARPCSNGGRRLDRGAAMPGGGWLVGAARAGGGEAGGLRDPEDDAETDHPAGPNHPRPGSRRWHWRRRGDGPRSGRRRTESITFFLLSCGAYNGTHASSLFCFFGKTYGPTDMWAKEGASTPHQHEHNP
jgi:hypothetical protein